MRHSIFFSWVQGERKGEGEEDGERRTSLKWQQLLDGPRPTLCWRTLPSQEDPPLVCLHWIQPVSGSNGINVVSETDYSSVPLITHFKFAKSILDLRIQSNMFLYQPNLWTVVFGRCSDWIKIHSNHFPNFSSTNLIEYWPVQSSLPRWDMTSSTTSAMGHLTDLEINLSC